MEIVKIQNSKRSRRKGSKWDIKSIFKAAYTILHDTPAWREDFISVTGEERFPLFFCATCSVEDTVVADRLIEIWENITKIARYSKRLPKSNQLSSKSFFKVREAANDKFILAKFHFFSFLEVFLNHFLQSSKSDGQWYHLCMMICKI